MKQKVKIEFEVTLQQLSLIRTAIAIAVQQLSTSISYADRSKTWEAAKWFQDELEKQINEKV